MNERVQSSGHRLRCMLFGAGCLIASPIVTTPTDVVAASESTGAAILQMRNYIMSRLQAIPDLDVRAIRTLRIAGRCAPASPCGEETASAIATAPPLQVSTMVCELQVDFDGRPIAEFAIEGRGRGSSCNVAQRDAPLQIGARVLSVLKPEVRDWSDQEQLDKLARVLDALDHGVGRLRESIPETAFEALLEANDDVLREVEQ